MVDQIETFKQSHLRWINQLHDVARGKTQLHQEDVDTHTECNLGQWYVNRGVQDYGHLAEFKAIEQPHAQLHQVVIDTVAAFNRGDVPAGEAGLVEAERLSVNVVEALERLEKVVLKQSSGEPQSLMLAGP